MRILPEEGTTNKYRPSPRAFQWEKRADFDPMSGTETSDEPTWSAALREALARHPSKPDELLLFFEDRQDATLELDGRNGPPASEHSWTRGLAAHGPPGGGRFRFQADPEVADAERLVSGLLDDLPKSTRIGNPGPDPPRPGR